jgi:hypothetical protein
LEKNEMNSKILKLLAFMAGVFGATAAAGEFDGSEPLICSFGQVVECDAGASCRAVSHDSVDAPDFVKLNFKTAEIVSTTAAEDSAADDINVTDLGNFLIVQGTQGSGQGDTLGYSLSIEQATGQMVAAGAGENAGFVIFGACTTY